MNKIKKNEEGIDEGEMSEDKDLEEEVKNKEKEHKMDIEEYYGVKQEEECQEEIYFGY